MCTDFVLQVKFTIFWLNRGLRVYLDLYASDFPKSTSQYFLHPSTFKSQTPYFGGFFGKRNHPNHVKYILAKKEESFVKNTFNIWVWTSLNDWIAQNNSLFKYCIQKWLIAVKHLDPCFLTTLVKYKYLEIILGKSGAYKSKCTLKPLLSQNMVNFTWRTKSMHME